MHKPGESVVSIDAGSASDRLHVIVVFGSIFLACVIIGAIIGLILRRQPRVHVPVGIVVSLLAYGMLEWRFAASGEWSWQHPIASAAYQIGPVALAFVAPTLLGSAIVRRFQSSRTQASNQSLQPTARLVRDSSVQKNGVTIASVPPWLSNTVRRLRIVGTR